MAVNPEQVNMLAVSIILGDQIRIGGAIYEVVDNVTFHMLAWEMSEV